MAGKYTKPTEAQILKEFKRCTDMGGDSEFQFKRAVRRWMACGYELDLIPHYFSGFSIIQFTAAIRDAVAELRDSEIIEASAVEKIRAEEKRQEQIDNGQFGVGA